MRTLSLLRSLILSLLLLTGCNRAAESRGIKGEWTGEALDAKVLVRFDDFDMAAMEWQINGHVNTFDLKYEFKPSNRSVKLTLKGVGPSAGKNMGEYEGYMKDDDTLILNDISPLPPPEVTAGLKLKPREPWRLSRKKTAG